MTVVSSLDTPMNTYYQSWMLYFDVPKGTKVTGLHGGGPVRLLTVPSCFACSAEELLLPREVIESD